MNDIQELEMMAKHREDEQFCPVTITNDPDEDMVLHSLPCLCPIIGQIRIHQTEMIATTLMVAGGTMRGLGWDETAQVMIQTGHEIVDLVRKEYGA